MDVRSFVSTDGLQPLGRSDNSRGSWLVQSCGTIITELRLGSITARQGFGGRGPRTDRLIVRGVATKR